MPTQTTYPGVYIEEVSSGVRTITGVATAVAAFVGYFPRGPMNEATRIFSWGDFERSYGGLDSSSEASYAVKQFFLNGGSQAYIIRAKVEDASGSGITEASSASMTLVSDVDDSPLLELTAANEGSWGTNLRVLITHVSTVAPLTFNLTVEEFDDSGAAVASETFLNLVVDDGDPNNAADVINDESDLIQVALATGATADGTHRPKVHSAGDGDPMTTPGVDGTYPSEATTAPAQTQIANALKGSQSTKTGMYALLDVDLFNLLCIPDTMLLGDSAAATVITEATDLCESERAFFLLDVPQFDSTRDEPDEIETWINDSTKGAGFRHKNAAVYYPRAKIADPNNNYRLRTVPPSGTIAGLFSRIDSNRGVWKAAAGTEASLKGVQDIEYLLTDAENGALNPLGINCLRAMPIYGNICWGARTLNGSDQEASEWKYISVRRVALYIEESLYRGLQWVVFEGNDEKLWSQIRLNVGAFMNNLFRQGAFQGTSAKEAYFVKCDSETTTQNDIDRGIVNIVVGFAPLKPAEFVIIKLQQIAGQIEV